ncbi:MAG: AAA family ATPase, partial [Phycisphaerales bacterium]|nr:AAA family ATPase [Phycisphaerales bacterium]
MLTAIEIENFKAFGERQRIELRPITLLFGPNSGGKSSVTHALHYLREVLLHRNLDAHGTRSGGESLDLGGIRNFVHGRKIGTAIRLKAEFTLSGAELPAYPWYGEEIEAELYEDATESVRGQISSAGIEVEVDSEDRPTVRSWNVWFNGEHFAEFWMPRERPHAEVRRINWLHPCLLLDAADREMARVHRAILARQTELENVGLAKEKDAALEALLKQKQDAGREYPGALAAMYEQIGGTPARDESIEVPQPIGPIPEFGSRLVIPKATASGTSDVRQFEALLSMLMFGPAVVLRERLRELRYVGPLRTMPPRQFEPRDRSGRSRWSTGLQAWELLAHGQEMTPARREGEGSLLEEVSRWLEAEDRLDTGYRLEREEFKQVPSNIAAMVSDPEFIDRIEILAETIKSLPDQARIVLRDVGRNLLLQPQDVGVGLSQIVPVIVALLDPGGPLVALEQPELHLHPRQQAALGDAIIKGMTATPNRVLLIETHSEHLILRVLRRIRETTRKQALSGQSLTPDQLRIQYVRREGSVSRAQTIDVDVNGDLVDPWPDDFF